MCRFILALLLIINIFGCEKSSENNYQIEYPVFLKNSELFNSVTCFSIGNIDGTKGLVIDNSETYRVYEDSMRIHPINNNCDTASLINLDFDKKTLLGIKIGYGPSDSLTKEITVDNENQKIVYNIDIAKNVKPDHSLILYLDLNLALIEKIPTDYNVVFHVNEHD